MIKRILLLAAIYAGATILLTVTISEKKSFITILVLLNMVFAVFFALAVYQYFRRLAQDNRPSAGASDRSNTVNFDSTSVFKISRKPFLLGIEKSFVSQEDFYFDRDFFYAVDDGTSALKYPLSDIAELCSTSTQLNNSRVWKIKVYRGPELIEYKFTHNFSIWNKNFRNFYQRVKEIRPQAVTSEWSMWSM